MQEFVVLQSEKVKVPLFGLGTSHAGGYSHDAVVHALRECDYHLIDTARRYGNEEKLRVALQESGVPREEVFLTTKLWPTDYGFQSTRRACIAAMNRLGVDYLDMYLMHWPECLSSVDDPSRVREDTWRALESLRDDGLVRVVGVSNFLEHHLEEMLDYASHPPSINQIEFHPYQNPIKLRKFCKEHGIQIMGFCPLAKGKILNDPVLREIASRVGKSPAQVSIRWSLQQGVITIPKSVRKERILENSQVWDWELNEKDMDALNGLDRDYHAVNRSVIQAKIDTALPDGYKLNTKLNMG
ncbi:unnamed protein product [Darwinula stevensoni]|uniref:NADP-dependent oxidoreductase domain-containing protein n=1 Tax=Darwinula stevensoni TaxID=69355 RepID=A0A7R9A1D4_9CRUS|nr:unnamed protein product [Darwinula stevensoni]CAG0887495.1 unnamed protein product [Darwinula stevensoni]